MALPLFSIEEEDRRRKQPLTYETDVTLNEVPGKFTGDIGCGKTLLTRTFVKRLDARQYDIALLTNPRWDGVELLREILYQSGQPADATDKNLILRKIEERWFSSYQNGRHTVLIID